MKIGLVGFQGSGKTSVFNALTGQLAETGLGKKGANLGRIQVPDPRVTKLSEIFQPKKTTHAELQFVDVAGPAESTGSGLDASLVAAIRESDALVHVVRAFVNPMVAQAPDPVRDIAAFDAELILTDLLQVETRLSRIKKQARTKELDVLEKLKESFEEGRPLRTITLPSDEAALLQGFAFLSQKPQLLVINVEEDAVGKPLPAEIEKETKERNLQAIAMCATIESEIMRMDPADQAGFLQELGIEQPVRTRFIQAAYTLLDLISFLTVGPDEVRAWTIKRGTIAKVAAGKIHSDIEKGFIRAEVTAYEDFIAAGSEAKARELGKQRLEGKEYVILDGEIVHFRHSG